jgi:lysophospholipase L1-like esterase
MVKPLRVLLLLIYVGMVMGSLELLPNELNIWDEQKLKIPKLSSLFTTEKSALKDISNIREKFEVDNADANSKRNVAQTDNKEKVKRHVPDSLKLNPEMRIQFPEGQDTLLNGFFRALKRLEQGRDTSIRVLHFGDSQLEGDRITAFLRDKFQQTFGGCGTGALNVVDKLNTKTSIAQNTRSNWMQYAAYGPKYNRGAGNFYGFLGDFYKFPVPEKSEWTKASFSYFKSPHATPRQQRVENLKLFYRNPDSPIELTLQMPGQPEVKTKLEPSSDFEVFQYNLTTTFENVTVQIATASKSPEIYGVALDGNRGITFDNIPLRGSSGVEFTRIQSAHLKKQLEKLNVRFLILQFGVNMVPNPLSDYTFYEQMFYEQLRFLKSLKPNLSILVVGVSDMSRNISGNYESYPNIEKIRNAQKNAAFKAGCAFWDLYEAMGGKNSMPSWVFAKPVALANKDFTHFTSKGAGIVSEMLYKAILIEYDKYNQFLF